MIRLVIFIFGTLGVGIICLISPISVLKIQKSVHKFMFSNLIGLDNVRSITREAFDLIENDPEAYKQRFWPRILAIRLTGVIALFMFIILLLSVISIGIS